MHERRHRRAGLVLVVLAAMLQVLACRDRGGDDEANAARVAALDRFAALPVFALTDQSGAPFGSNDIRGHVAIINFIFTRCPTVCPIFTLKFANLQRELGDAPVLYVSISVDPTHDTPAVLAAYAAEHSADPKRWKFLTGDPELIRTTAEDGLKLAMDRRGVLEDGTPDIVHASHFVLVDRGGTIRGYYDSDDKQRRRDLVLDARALATSKP